MRILYMPFVPKGANIASMSMRTMEYVGCYVMTILVFQAPTMRIIIMFSWMVNYLWRPIRFLRACIISSVLVIGLMPIVSLGIMKTKQRTK